MILYSVYILRLYTQTIYSDYTHRLYTQAIYSDYIFRLSTEKKKMVLHVDSD